MSNFFIKINDGKRDWFLHWSAIVDAPVSVGMSYAELEAHILKTDGEDGLKFFETYSKDLLFETNCSSSLHSVDLLFKRNRAGYREHPASKKEILEGYCYHHYLFYGKRNNREYQRWKRKNEGTKNRLFALYSRIKRLRMK